MNPARPVRNCSKKETAIIYEKGCQSWSISNRVKNVIPGILFLGGVGVIISIKHYKILSFA
jgi:hypothetical protein